MGGEEDGLAELPEPGDDLPGGAAGRRVETGGRLVQEEQFRVADEGEGEIEPAPLAAGEPGAERARLPGETDQRDGLVDIPRRAVEPGVHGQALPDGQAGLGLRLLQDHAHPVPPGPARRRRILPQDGYLSLRPLLEAFEDLYRRGLARAVRAQEGEDLSPPHLQGDARDRLLAAIPLRQAADADDRLGPGWGGESLTDAVFLAAAVHLDEGTNSGCRGRHPMVRPGWKLAVGPIPHPKVVPDRPGGGVRGSGQAPGPGQRPRSGWRRRACPAHGSRAF